MRLSHFANCRWRLLSILTKNSLINNSSIEYWAFTEHKMGCCDDYCQRWMMSEFSAQENVKNEINFLHSRNDWLESEEVELIFGNMTKWQIYLYGGVISKDIYTLCMKIARNYGVKSFLALKMAKKLFSFINLFLGFYEIFLWLFMGYEIQ